MRFLEKNHAKVRIVKNAVVFKYVSECYDEQSDFERVIIF